MMNAPTKKTTEVVYYKTNLGLFVRNMWGMAYSGYSSTSYFTNYKFNGKSFGNTLVGGFLHLPNLMQLDSLQERVAPVNKVIGYSPKDDLPPVVTDALKSFYSLEDVQFHYDDEEEKSVYLNTEFSKVSTLYQPVYELSEESWIDCEIKHTILGELVVDNFNKPESMSVRVHNDVNCGSSKIVDADLSSIVCYSDFEKMLTPEFMLHMRPCTITSDQVYKIVRAYIKDNINPRAAAITSDYDFCFTVKRKVMQEPVVTRTEQKKDNGRSYATPRFTTRTTTHSVVDLFEMTNTSNRYRGYTVIQPWTADNLQEMQEQVKYYLDNLMKEINTETCKCEHCNGIGTIVTKIPTNNR